ncbi:retrovirus-related Pol polyprotein from transposon 297 [Trichonephila clavipes]|uniref:Retrovirus-related Pol polyprotein from transposon 297 n=1 Tax=Trichonephila clavipes TaxID=2585209 RepID=A0A8X6RF41_TRICX|nr:retrovirus-related Pol polyprotein from transposon 297 [Trichonephila clavipes]
MSYHKNTKKEDFINVLKAIGEQATSKEIIIHLKNKLEISAAFKDDPDFVMNLLNLSVEDKQTKSEQQLQVINSQLELEKIKLQQIEREIELQKTLAKGQATQQSSKKDAKNLENLIKSAKTMESENKYKNTDYIYVEVIVDDTLLSATLDSGANSVIIIKKYFSEEKIINSEIVLKSESDEAGSTDASCNPVCLQNETEGENYVGVSGGDEQIDEGLYQGIIRESCSDFSSPVVVCEKKDVTMRLGIDYRKLNKEIIKDRYPLPIIEEVLDKLGNEKIFMTLDLKNAFFHVDVDEASRKYTVFVTKLANMNF